MKKQLSKGFTLIEILIVIVILGIISGIAVPKLTSVMAKAKSAEVPIAAGSYIKLQDASVAETGNIGNWKKIGYIAPGTRGSTAHFQYSEGDLYEESTKLENLGEGKIGWQATNTSTLNSCAMGSWWTVKISHLSGNYVNYKSEVSSSECVQISGFFEAGNTVGSGNLTPGGVSNIEVAVNNTQGSSSNSAGGIISGNGGNQNNSGNTANNTFNNGNESSNENNIAVNNTLAGNGTTNSNESSNNGGVLNTIMNMIGLGGSSSSAEGGTVTVASTENAGSTNGTSGGTTGGSVGGSAGGSTGGAVGSGGTTSGNGETTNGTTSGNEVIDMSELSKDTTTSETDSTAKNYDPNDVIAGSLETKSGGWNGDGFRKSTDKDAGMVNLKDGITAGVLYTYNTGETEAGKEGLYVLEANSTYTFTVSDADVSWGKNDWLQTDIRVYTESNFTAKGSSSGAAAVLCGTTQKSDSAKAADYAKNGIWATTGYNTSSNTKGFDATGEYDKTTGVTTFTIKTGDETGYFGANFRMNASNDKLGKADTTIQQQVKTAIQNSTLIKQ